jgi:hypothetical protein
MAQQTALKRNEATPLKRGRPPGSRNKTPAEKAAENPKAFDYSRFKLTFQKPADFYRYLAGYPERTGLCAYLYRLKPLVDNGLIGNDETHCYQTTNEAEMSEEFMAATYGRGLYMLVLNDANRPKGQSEMCRTWFDCGMAPKAPQYDPRTLKLGESKNLDEINRLLNIGVLIRDTNGQPRIRTEADGAPPPAAAAMHNGPPTTADMIGKDVLGQVLLSVINRGSESPHQSVKDTIDMARLMIPEHKPIDVDTIVERVVSRLAPQAQPVDPFSNYERMENFISKVRGPAGVVAAAVDADSSPATWLPHVPGILSEIRGLFREVFQDVQTMRTNGNGQAAQNGQPQQQQRQPMTLEDRVEEVARLGYTKMQEGVQGWDYASYVWFHHPGGAEVFAMLEPGGAAGLIGLASMNPKTRPLVNDPAVRAKLESFLTDFFTFSPNLQEADSLPAAAAGSEA